MILLEVLHSVSIGFLIIVVTSLLGSRWDRWKQADTRRNIKTGRWRMVEPWMIILSFVLGTSVWVIGKYPQWNISGELRSKIEEVLSESE